MTFKLADRVQETTATSGTGSLALHGAVAGFQSFAATMAVGDTTYYAISDPVALTWEIGLGTFATGNTLTRTTVLASSHGGAKIALAGNAGTQVWQDMPASVLAALIAAQGTVASVTDGVTTVTNAATIDFTSGATVSNVGGVAAVAISAGSPLEVLGGGGTITNATTINFTSGGTVSSGGAGVANVAISGGGGGGSYAAGLGIYFTGTSPTTIGNTGTIVQPAATAADNGLGISLVGGAGGPDGGIGGTVRLLSGGVTTIGTAGGGSGSAYIDTGDVNITGTSGYGGAGAIQQVAGSARGPNSGVGAGAYVFFGGGSAYANLGNYSGGYAGLGTGYGTTRGGNLTVTINGSGPGGTNGNLGIVLGGSGASGGLFTVSGLPTADPMVTYALWRNTITNSLNISAGP